MIGQIFTLELEGNVFLGWDIRIVNALVQGRTPNFDLDVAEWWEKQGVMSEPYIDHAHAESLTLEQVAQPVYIARYVQDGVVYGGIIDGQHRLWRQHRAGVMRHPAFALTLIESNFARIPDETAKIIHSG